MSDKSEANRIGAWWDEYYKVLKNVLKGLSSENIAILASGMVYSTLIALIPCLTFFFTFLSSFGVLQSFLDVLSIWLSETFGSDTAVQLLSEIQNYSSNAMSLGVIGLVSFLFTGIMLVDKIYGVINQIYKTRSQTGTIRRYGTFLIFLIVFTFLISMTFALSSTLTARFDAYVKNIEVPMTMAYVFRKIGSFALVWFIFFLFLMCVPSTKVRPKSASIAASTGLVFISIVNIAFNSLVSRLVSYWTIYGTLASIFFVLLYLYIFWYILIAVTELAYIHQFKPDKNTLSGLSQSPAKTVSEAIDLFLVICRKYQMGEGFTTTREISRSLRIPTSRIVGYLHSFEEAGFVLASNSQYSAFIPARPLDSISVKDVIRLIYGTEDAISDSIDTIGEAVAMELYHKGEKGFSSLTIENLLERI